MSSKVIVTNASALRAKFGADGKRSVDAALKRLIAADSARGITCRVVAIDSAAAMKAAKGKAVSSPDDAPGAKRAIDAVARKHRPDYLMILGGPDIVPHQPLLNGLFTPGIDDDPTVPSDLPYACEQAYSTDPGRFLGATRVVGRLPDLAGGSPRATDPAYLVGLIDRAANAVRRPAEDFASFLGVTAEVWKESTDLTLLTMFGRDSASRPVPPQGPPWSAADLASRVIFINCHGAMADPSYYGEPATGPRGYPEAFRASDLQGAVSEGAVIAAECCYGAELYDPALAAHQSIVNTALEHGAYGFFGSSTIAYGPADGNELADLITRYFIQQVLAGASIGRAALIARQRFVQQGAPMDPYELKTLTQFNLMGDPSIHPVATPAIGPGGTPGVGPAKALGAVPAAALAGGNPDHAARAMRRAALLDIGLRLGATVAACAAEGKPIVAPGARRSLAKVAREYGLDPSDFRRFAVTSPMKGVYSKAGLAPALPEEVRVAAEGRRVEQLKRSEVRAVVALIRDGDIVSVRLAYSR